MRSQGNLARQRRSMGFRVALRGNAASERPREKQRKFSWQITRKRKLQNGMVGEC